MFIVEMVEKFWEESLSRVFRLNVSGPLCLALLGFSFYNNYSESKDNFKLEHSLKESAQVLRKDVDFVQEIAAKDRENLWSIRFYPNRYQLLKNGKIASQSLPSGGSGTKFAENCLITAGTGELKFDRWGSPVSGKDYKVILVNDEFKEEVQIFSQTPYVAEFLKR